MSVAHGAPLDEGLLDAVPKDAVDICLRLSERGLRGWIVGGCVRDLLRGAEAKDWDVATDARPKQVQRMFRRVIPTGIKHGTVTVLRDGEPYEVTTLRGEGAYHDGRRPEEVEFIQDIVEDLARRDFTFNAMAIDPLTARLIDPFQGRQDLEDRLLRAVGQPQARFAEDGLRVLRATRFAATLECTIEPATLKAMGARRSLDTLAKVSAERVRDEWLKTMLAPKPSTGFSAMEKCRALEVICPELVEAVGCEQNRWHSLDVWEHSLAVVDACPADPILRMAALLHDVAKPRTRRHSNKTEDYTFYNHESVGADLADQILRRLKLSNEDRQRAVHIIRHHLLCYSPDWTDAAVRRWVRRVTPDRMVDLFAMGRADALGKGRACEEDLASVDQLEARVAAVLAAGAALGPRDLAVNGTVLMAELDLEPGPVVGELMRELVEMVTDDPTANEPDRLVEAARLLLAERRGGQS
ncbi:MAG: HD domain-containing protein [Deltaproteobacteria bacterium]|nr:HD domain-containing protein [Deltaproteobacteria bacterium]